MFVLKANDLSLLQGKAEMAYDMVKQCKSKHNTGFVFDNIEVWAVWHIL